MNLSDFLTLLAIFCAVWAIIPMRKRRFTLLLFSKKELGMIVFSLVYIHFLLSFYWLSEQWIPQLSVFIYEKGILSNVWAYILSISLGLYIIMKINYSFFRMNNIQELLSIYKTMLHQGEVDDLVYYLKKYHMKDLVEYMSEVRNEDMPIFEDFLQDSNKLTREKIAEIVYHNIIKDDEFIEKASSLYYDIFLQVINGMQVDGEFDDDFVNKFLEVLFEEQSSVLSKELKELSDVDRKSIEEHNKVSHVPIMNSLCRDSKLAVKNRIWYSIGESTIRLLKNDSNLKSFLSKKYDGDLIKEFKNTKVYIAVLYFDSIVKESIHRDGGHHLWLYYYKYFVHNLLVVEPNDNKGEPTFSNQLVKVIVERMMGWLRLSTKLKNSHRVIDTIRCLGECIYEIVEPNDKDIHLLEDSKKEMLGSLLMYYLEVISSDFNGEDYLIIQKKYLEKLFFNPINLNSQERLDNQEYKRLMTEIILTINWRDYSDRTQEIFDEKVKCNWR